MDRRLSVALLVACLVVILAGCSAPGVGGSGTHDSPTTTPEQPETPRGATDTNTIAYGELSADEQRAFDAAVEDEARFFHSAPEVDEEFFHPDLAHPLEASEYVRKNGTFYRLSSYQGALYASYDIGANASEPGPNATVVALQNLSVDVRRPVRWAIENGSYTVPMGTWNSLPTELQRVEYVRDDNGTYRLGFAVGDGWVEVWEAEAVPQ